MDEKLTRDTRILISSQENPTKQAIEKKLRESEERLHILFEQPSLGISYVDTEGHWLQANQKLCDIVGYSREELLERSFQDITYHDELATSNAYFKSLVAGEISTYTMEKRYIRKDGVLTWVNITVSLVRDSTGAPQYIIAFVEDINERKQAEEERLQSLQREKVARAEAEEVAEKLTVLQSITDTALAHLKLENVLDELIHRIGDILHADIMAILLPTLDKQYLKVEAALGLEPAQVTRIAIPIGDNLPDRMRLSQEPMIVENLARVKALSSLPHEKWRSLIIAPLLIEGRSIGLLVAGTTHRRRFVRDDALLLQRVADRIALVIDHVRLYEAEQQARAEATARAQQLEAVINTMADGLFVYDDTGHIVHMNAAAREILGGETLSDQFMYSASYRAELQSPRDEQGQLLPEELLPTNRIMRGEVFKGAEAMDIIVQMPDAHSDMHLSVSGAPLRNERGQITGGVTVVRDVTARRNLEQRTHKALEGLLAMAEALVQLPDSSGEVDRVGQRLAELTCSVLGCQRVGIATLEAETEILRPLAVAGLSPEQEHQWWEEQRQNTARLSEALDAQYLTRLYNHEVLVFDMMEPPFQNQPNPYNIEVMLAAPMYVGDRLMGILTLDYGSVRHKYSQEEIALAGAIATLAALVIERQRLLNEQAEARGREVALREANRRMEEFLGIASHELRTPLTTIKANTQLALRRLKDLLAQPDSIQSAILDKVAVAYTMLERAERQEDVLNRLISDMLDISRIQSGKFQFNLQQKPAELTTIVQEVIREQQKATPGRRIYMRLLSAAKVPVIVDTDRIAQVLTNYLSNALKYSPVSSPIEVSLTVEQGEQADAEPQIARVSVHDEGPGLSAQEQERIWDCFYQSRDVQVQSGSGVGLGLGLYVSRTIIERHHGQVGVQSIPGKGSTFWFTLPLIR